MPFPFLLNLELFWVSDIKFCPIVGMPLISFAAEQGDIHFGDIFFEIVRNVSWLSTSSVSRNESPFKIVTNRKHFRKSVNGVLQARAERMEMSSDIS